MCGDILVGAAATTKAGAQRLEQALPRGGVWLVRLSMSSHDEKKLDAQDRVDSMGVQERDRGLPVRAICGRRKWGPTLDTVTGTVIENTHDAAISGNI